MNYILSNQKNYISPSQLYIWIYLIKKKVVIFFFVLLFLQSVEGTRLPNCKNCLKSKFNRGFPFRIMKCVFLKKARKCCSINKQHIFRWWRYKSLISGFCYWNTRDLSGSPMSRIFQTSPLLEIFLSHSCTYAQMYVQMSVIRSLFLEDEIILLWIKIWKKNAFWNARNTTN